MKDLKREQASEELGVQPDPKQRVRSSSQFCRDLKPQISEGEVDEGEEETHFISKNSSFALLWERRRLQL
jgi:hypothetical protein